MWYNREHGWVAEWSKAPVLKTGVSQGTVSSNLTPSAKIRNQKKWTKWGRAEGATPFRLQKTISNFGGICWTKFECFSKKIQTN